MNPEDILKKVDIAKYEEQYKDILMKHYEMSEEEANEKMDEIKKMNVEIINRLLTGKLKTKKDVINIIKEYNIVSSNEIIALLEKGMK